MSAGGAVGAVVAIATGMAGLFFLALPTFAFVGAIAATFLVYGIAAVGGHFSMATLLLAGVAVNAFLGAIVSAIIIILPDMIASFFEIEWVPPNDFEGNWMPAGGLGWEDKVDQSTTVDFVGVELQGPDPVELADRWGKVAGLPVSRDGEVLSMQLNNVDIRFVEATDGRGAGLGGLDISVADKPGILQRAKERGAYVSDDQVMLCGTRWNLIEA